MKGCDLSLSLADGCLHQICVRHGGRNVDTALSRQDFSRKRGIKQKGGKGLCKGILIQAYADIGKGGITGFGKGFSKVHLSMLRAVITADLTVPVLEGSGALEGIILTGVRIFPDIFQGSNDLKGGAGG